MESLHPLRSLFVAVRPPFPVIISELLHRFPRQGIELDTCIVYLPARLSASISVSSAFSPVPNPISRMRGEGAAEVFSPMSMKICEDSVRAPLTE